MAKNSPAYIKFFVIFFLFEIDYNSYQQNFMTIMLMVSNARQFHKIKMSLRATNNKVIASEAKQSLRIMQSLRVIKSHCERSEAIS